MMGIGFGRESSQQPRGTSDYNPFLNLQSILQNDVLRELPLDWCNGYVVCPDGIYLGLTSLNTANAAFVKLMPWTEYSNKKLPEWKPAPMTISTNGVSGSGHILMDTGVGTSYLTPPLSSILGTLITCPGSSLVQCLPNRDVIHVYLPDQTNPVAYYTFTVGKGNNLMQPNGVHVVKGSNIFLNTGRHYLVE